MLRQRARPQPWSRPVMFRMRWIVRCLPLHCRRSPPSTNPVPSRPGSSWSRIWPGRRRPRRPSDPFAKATCRAAAWRPSAVPPAPPDPDWRPWRRAGPATGPGGAGPVPQAQASVPAFPSLQSFRDYNPGALHRKPAFVAGAKSVQQMRFRVAATALPYAPPLVLCCTTAAGIVSDFPCCNAPRNRRQEAGD